MTETELKKHDIGNSDCGECWRGFPRPCLGCGAMVHADWGDYIDAYEGSFYLEYRCEGCGDDCEVDDD